MKKVCCNCLGDSEHDASREPIFREAPAMFRSREAAPIARQNGRPIRFSVVLGFHTICLTELPSGSGSRAVFQLGTAALSLLLMSSWTLTLVGKTILVVSQKFGRLWGHLLSTQEVAVGQNQWDPIFG